MISLPATIKIVNWTLTLLKRCFKMRFSTYYLLLHFVYFFLSGGLTGMWLSHVSLNVSMHDTFYVIAHFHLMFSAGVITGSFAGIYYYFPALFGIKYSTNLWIFTFNLFFWWSVNDFCTYVLIRLFRNA